MLSQSALKHSDKYLFNIEDYKIINEVKKGGFGVINLVRNNKNGNEYAAKTNLIQNTKQNKHYILREVRILIQVRHPTIIKFKGFSYVDFENKKNITILMDYMKNGSLADIISKEEKGLCPHEYDNTKRQIILIGIARGMMILHRLHIIHRDLKPENILLGEDFHPHITDFGLSKFFDPGHSMSQSVADTGTAAYMAPEVIRSNNFNTKADVYAFGILMYEVLTGKRAYTKFLKGKNKITIFQLKTNICNGLRPEIEEGIMKKSFRLMIEKCWSEDPKQRPTFSELYRKLSLSSQDSILQFEDFNEKEIINYEEEEENEEEEEIGLYTNFCLKSVDYEEILDYVDEISVEPRSLNQESNKSSDSNADEIERLRKIVDELKLSSKNQEKYIKDKEKEIEQLKNQVDYLKKASENQEKYIKDQDDKIELLKKQADDLKTASEMQEKNMRDKDELINKLKNMTEHLNERVQKLEKNNENSELYDKTEIAIQTIEEIEKKPAIFSCRFSDENICKGILSNYKDSIKITAGGSQFRDFPLSNITIYDNTCFHNNNNCVPGPGDSYIKFDFGQTNKVDLYSYFIRSNSFRPSFQHPKSWVVEGSNDEINWTPLDNRTDDESLKGPFKQKNFECQTALHEIENEKFRYIRFVQEDSWRRGSPYTVCISYFELFGDFY